MRRTRIPMLALAALVAVPAVASAQGKFEGAVTYQIATGNGTPATMVYYVKGDKARVESSFDGHNAVMLYDAGSGQMTMVMPEQKMYMTMGNVNDMKPRDQKHYKITGPGRTETIAGHPCQDWQVQQEGDREVTTMCIAKGMGDFLFARSRMERNQTSLQALLADPQFREVIKGGFFPLKVVSNNEKTEFVATKIAPGRVDDAMFAVPPGYQQFSMPNMRPPGH
jgi:hypothetical protein